MFKTVDWLGILAALFTLIRFLLIPLFIRLLGSIAFYIASKLGEQAALDYLEQNVPLFRRRKS